MVKEEMKTISENTSNWNKAKTEFIKICANKVQLGEKFKTLNNYIGGKGGLKWIKLCLKLEKEEQRKLKQAEGKTVKVKNKTTEKKWK